MLLTFDPLYWLMLAPALLLGLWAQMRVKSTFARAAEEPAPMTGAAAARMCLIRPVCRVSPLSPSRAS